jgi:hypothetical protein
MKTIFKNKTFFRLLIGYISILFLWNIYIGISTSNFWAIIPVTFAVVLLTVILTNDRYAKVIIMTGAIILIVACFLDLLASVLDIGNNILDHEAHGIGFNNIIYNLVQLIIQVLILDFTRRTVKVEFPVDKDLGRA